MPRSRACHFLSASLVALSLTALPHPAQSAPENKRCLTRDQLNIEPIFSACPPLIDEASVSDNSFIATLYINGGPSRYTMRWRGQNYFNEDIFEYNEATGLYDGFCATRACSIGPGGWVKMEHWQYFVGTLLADNIGTWTYEELHDDTVFQSRTFEVRELSLSALSGAEQIGIVDQNLPHPLVLKLESFEGAGIGNEVIGWSIDGPRGAKKAAVYGIGSGSETDANGVDDATIHLGSKPGTYTVTLNNRRVTADSAPTFTFTAIDDIRDLDPDQEHPDVEEGVGETRAQQCDSVGNPVTLSLGNKFQREVDLESHGLSPIEFVRYHNSFGFVSKSFASYWTHTYDRYIEIPDDPHHDPVKVVRPDGKKLNFSWAGDGYRAQPGNHSSLEETVVGWRFVDSESSTENFDASGLLVDITDRYGRSQIASYNSRGQLSRIEDNIGGSLDFSYDGSGRLAAVTDQAGRVWSYGYEILGRLARVDNPDGTTREYHYEDLRHAYALTGITGQDGRRYSWYDYDEQGRASASYHVADAGRVDIRYEPNGDRIVLDPLGDATVYQTHIENKRGVLDAISGPICSQGCGQTDTQFSYDADLNVTSKTVYGVTTHYGDYDAKGQPGYVIQAAGTTEEKRIDYEYDPRYLNRVTRITEPSVFSGASRITRRSYDLHGNLVTEDIAGFDPFGQPVSRSVTQTFDGPFGQVSSTDGPRTDVADITSYEYYPETPAEGPNRARLRAVVDPNGIRTRDDIVYSLTGKVLSEVRPNGITVNYEYYPGSDLIRAVTESGAGLFNRTQWEYSPNGDVRRLIIDDEVGDEIITRFIYDGARRLQRIESRVSKGLISTADQWVSYEFDAAGNVIAESWSSSDSPNNDILIERVFDAYDRLETLRQGGISVDFEFNADGTLASRTDGSGKAVTHSYDVFRRLTRTTQVGQYATSFGYDTQGNQTETTNPEGHTTRYLYDDLGNRVRQDSPDTGTTTYSHNGSGQVVGQTDAEGQSSVLTYDAAGRLTDIDRPGSDYDVTYQFDECGNGEGRLCAVMTGWGHLIKYGWNPLGELASVTTDQAQVRYTHGPRNSLTSITYPSGRVVQFDIDGAGLPVQIRLRSGDNSESILVDDIRYSPLGRPIAWRFGNGRQTTIALDSRHRPVGIEVAGLWNWKVTGYDASDNILGLESGAETFAYGYDVLDRLTSAESSSWNIAYTYDGVGNRLSKVTNGRAEMGAYEAGSNRLSGYGARQYTLDRNGNMTAVTVDQVPATTYVYSSHDRLLEIVDENSAATRAAYRYDALGQRVEKATATAVRNYIYGLNGEMLAILDGSGKILHEYVYLDGQPVVDLGEVADGTAPSTAVERIIDNGDASVHGANWQTKSSSAAVNGSYLQNRKRDDRAIYWYIDQPGFAGGSHDVYVKWLQPAGDGSSTTYEVRVAGGTTHRVTIGHEGRAFGDWVYLGNFDFAPAGSGPAQYVGLTGFNNSYGLEGTFLEADAVKVVPTYIPGGTSNLRFIHGDHLGTPQIVTDESGAVIWSARYLPFGEAATDEDSDADGNAYTLDLRFPGQYYDEESGLHYNHFRTYDPTLGRFLESDPIGMEGGPNPFLYAKAHPMRFTDPLGLMVHGEWIETPRFNLHEAGVDDWSFVTPSFSAWGYLRFIRVLGHATGHINVDVRCTENCDEWEIHDRVDVSARGAINLGPNLYALGAGLVTRNPFAGIGANVALGGAALLQAELHFLNLAQQKAGPLISALLTNGPTLICLGSDHDDL